MPFHLLRRANPVRSGFVLLACLAVVSALLLLAPAGNAWAAGFGCQADEHRNTLAVDVSGPFTHGGLQPIGHTITLSLVDGTQAVSLGDHPCPDGSGKFSVDVLWVGPTGVYPIEVNPWVVAGDDSPGGEPYSAYVTITEYAFDPGCACDAASGSFAAQLGAYVTFYQPQVTDATVDSSGDVTLGHAVQLTARALDPTPITTYTWYFDNTLSSPDPGVTGPDATVVHTYAAPGTYHPYVVITDALGASVAVGTTVHVATNLVPELKASPDSVPLGTPVHFDGSGSTTDGGYTVTGFAWDFGDGQHGSGETPVHLYTTTGRYTVTETVRDTFGTSASVTHDVTVTDSSTSTPSPSAPPVASFSMLPSQPTVGSPVSFDGSGSAAPGGSIADYAWTFGDGLTGTGPKASHTYRSAGSFPVTLTVIDAAGHEASVTQVIHVRWPATDLAVSVGGSAPKAGQYTYRVTVKNLGHTGAHGIVLTNALDAAQVLAGNVTAPAGVSCGGVALGASGTITCKAPSAVLAAGQSWVVTFTVKEPARTPARQVTETSVVRAANPDGVTRNNTARLTTAV